MHDGDCTPKFVYRGEDDHEYAYIVIFARRP
jgi:hypothetical protein